MGDELHFPPTAPAKAPARGRLTTLQKAELIRGLELFSQTSVEELYQLAAIAQEVEFPAQHVIYHKEDIGDAFYLLVQGKVECSSESLKTRTVAGPGESVGLHSALTREPRRSTAKALEDVFALAIGAEDFYSLLSCNTEMMVSIVKYFVSRMGIAPL